MSHMLHCQIELDMISESSCGDEKNLSAIWTEPLSELFLSINSLQFTLIQKVPLAQCFCFRLFSYPGYIIGWWH